MVLDEPVSNLDFGNQARVIAHICRFVQMMKKTVLMTTHFPDHSFLPDCRVILLHKNGSYSVGNGVEITTEETIRELYRIDNRIVSIPEYGKKTCIPLCEL
jgi:iron complex transport system ATP-binding protein